MNSRALEPIAAAAVEPTVITPTGPILRLWGGLFVTGGAVGALVALGFLALLLQSAGGALPLADAAMAVVYCVGMLRIGVGLCQRKKWAVWALPVTLVVALLWYGLLPGLVGYAAFGIGGMERAAPSGVESFVAIVAIALLWFPPLTVAANDWTAVVE